MLTQEQHLIASAIANAPRWDDGSIEEKGLIEEFTAQLAATNPQFDKDRFIDVATGVKER